MSIKKIAKDQPDSFEFSSSNVDAVTLPAQTNTTEVPASGSGDTPELPDFPAFKDTPQRKNNIELYGIVGVK